jgi:hypothetical protein
VGCVQHRCAYQRHIGSGIWIFHWVSAMTKQELLALLKLLSAIESAMSVNKAQLPNYLFEQIDSAVAILEREILK